MGDKVFEVELLPDEGLVMRFRPPRMRHMTGDACQHFRRAQREFLLAMRGLLDVAIEASAQRESARETSTKVEIQ